VSEAQEKNKALVRRFLEAQANGEPDTVKEMLAPDFVVHEWSQDQEPDHRERYLRALAEERAAFSDIRYIIEDQIAEGDKVMTRWTGRGRHDRGEYAGLAPTGRDEEAKIIDLHRVEGDKIADEWKGTTASADRQEERLAQVEQELLVARRIQQASLPKEVPQLEGWQITPYYQPAREVGGDFYDFHLLSEGRLGVVMGDATRKGLATALVMSTTCGMLQAVSRALASSPGEVLDQVNETLLARIPSNMFVTCFYAILEPESGTLSYANAGHDLPYLRRVGGDAEELRARGMPLGLMPSMSYEEKEILLDAGEGVLFYSDGLVEAHNPEGEMFGFPRLRELVAEHAAEERSLEEALLEELYTFVGEGWEQEDDITLLMLHAPHP